MRVEVRAVQGTGVVATLTVRCSRMYGGLVIPSLTMQPSGTTAASSHRSSGRLVPMSRPYAPKSSLVSHSSTTPSEEKWGGGWEWR